MWVLAIATRKLNDVQIVMLLSIRAPHRPCLLTLTLTLTLTSCSVSVRRKALACAQTGRGTARHGTAYRRLQQHCAQSRLPPRAAAHSSIAPRAATSPILGPRPHRTRSFLPLSP